MLSYEVKQRFKNRGQLQNSGQFGAYHAAKSAKLEFHGIRIMNILMHLSCQNLCLFIWNGIPNSHFPYLFRLFSWVLFNSVYKSTVCRRSCLWACETYFKAIERTISMEYSGALDRTCFSHTIIWTVLTHATNHKYYSEI